MSTWMGWNLKRESYAHVILSVQGIQTVSIMEAEKGVRTGKHCLGAAV